MQTSSDRLTQIQDQLDSISTMFYTCVGVLQRDSPPITIDIRMAEKYGGTHSPEVTQEDMKRSQVMIQDMATQLIEKVKAINDLIESLPGADASEAEQLNILESLDNQNRVVGQRLFGKVAQAGKFNC
jgi:hypothetical protein